jgi:hypothetical protein
MPTLTEDTARAQAMFRLGQFLIRSGDREEGDRWLAGARLHPDSWCIWRQRAGVNDEGVAALPDTSGNAWPPSATSATTRRWT